jgi:superfamily I DNA/RNA helicase
VLLLCYNGPLAELLRESVTDGPGDITAQTYHSFCLQTMQAAGEKIPIRADDPDFWRYDLPDLFDTWLEGHPRTWDAVIVDEAQDFIWSYWMTLEKILPPDGYLYIFYDPDQNLYGTDLQFPIEEKPFVLKRNCRNTVRIARKLMESARVRMDLCDGAPEGQPVVEVRCATEQELRKALGRALHEIIIEGKLRKEQVVILGGHNIDKTCLAGNNVVGSFTIEEKPRKGADVVRYSTYMRFKGCEADAVILLGVDRNDARWSDQALYTAMSRAKHLLYVLYRE